MKKTIGDLLAAIYFFGLLALVIFFIPGPFAEATRSHPYLMGFAKVSLLATFGEYLKRRLKSGIWQFDTGGVFMMRFTVWGIFGIWFTFAFALFSLGVDGCIKAGFWPAGPALWVAFSKSFWINTFGGYAFVMMLTHEWLNKCIEARSIFPLATFGEGLDKKFWFSFIPKTILYFWLPAHTLTFCLSGEWRILMAAVLSVVLGFLLTIKK